MCHAPTPEPTPAPTPYPTPYPTPTPTQWPCTPGVYCSSRIGGTINKGQGGVEQECQANSACVAIDYTDNGNGYGHLCSSSAQTAYSIYRMCHAPTPEPTPAPTPYPTPYP